MGEESDSMLRKLATLEQLFPHETFPDLSKRIHKYRDLFKSTLPTVACIGEWSRGKSSLINCLLEQTILPVDIRPTTASLVCIQASDSDEHAVLYKRNGTRQEAEISSTTLRCMQTSETNGIAQSENIYRVDLYLQHPLLKHCRLIDTPGVNDLNDTPDELIYQLLPFVDLVVFFFDCTNGGFSATEFDFIQQRVTSNFCSHFLIIGSHLDRVEFEDEEEESEFHEEIKEQMSHLFKKDVEIYLGTTDLHQSQSMMLTEKVSQYIIKHCEQAAESRRRHIKREILTTVQEHLQNALIFAGSNTQDVLNKIEYFNTVQGNLEKGFSFFTQHMIETAKTPILQMIQGSLSHLEQQCTVHLQRQIALTGRISAYAEHGLIQDLEQMLQQWTDVHTSEIKTFLMRHLEFVRQEYRCNFGDTVPFFPPKIQIHIPNDSNIVPMIDVASIKAQESESENIRYILPGVLSVIGGLIALPVGVAGLYAGLKLATDAQKNTESMIREQLSLAIPSLVQTKLDSMQQTIFMLLEDYFTSLESQLHRCLQNNLQYAQTQKDELLIHKDSLVSMYKEKEIDFENRWRKTKSILS